MRKTAALTTAILAAAASLLPATAGAQVTRINRSNGPLILEGAKVAAGTEMIFLSGQLAAPLDPKKVVTPTTVLTPDDFGDTKTQTVSTLNKIKEILASQGYTMGDIIKLTLFVAADPKTGKMDFAGANAGYKEFFGTKENPNLSARSTFQVANLVAPQYLIEIEAIAAKK